MSPPTDGSVTQDIGMNISFNRTMPSRNWTLKVATLPSEIGPFVEPCHSLSKNSSSSNTSYCGIIFEILNVLADQFGFDYEVVTDSAIGIIVNGTSTGVVGMAQRKEVDIAAYDITITDPRSEIIDFASPFFFHSTTIMILSPGDYYDEQTATMKPIMGGVKFWSWASPFQTNVWLCLIGLLVLVTLVLYFGHTYFPEETWADEKFLQIGECLAYVGTATINQGLRLSPKSWWSQTLLSLWWMVCLLQIASYGSFLVADLTAPNPQNLPFHTIQELAMAVQKGDYKICMPGGTVFYDDLTKSTADEYQIISAWLKANPKYVTSSSQACVDLLIHDPRVAVIDRTSTLEQYQKRSCSGRRFIILGERLYTRPVSFGFPKNSSLTRRFSKKMAEIMEHGLLDLWYRNYTRPSDKCTIIRLEDIDLIQASQSKLRLNDLAGVFVIFFVGICLGIVFSLVEVHNGRLIRLFVRSSPTPSVQRF